MLFNSLGCELLDLYWSVMMGKLELKLQLICSLPESTIAGNKLAARILLSSTVDALT